MSIHPGYESLIPNRPTRITREHYAALMAIEQLCYDGELSPFSGSLIRQLEQFITIERRYDEKCKLGVYVGIVDVANNTGLLTRVRRCLRAAVAAARNVWVRSRMPA